MTKDELSSLPRPKFDNGDRVQQWLVGSCAGARTKIVPLYQSGWEGPGIWVADAADAAQRIREDHKALLGDGAYL